MFNQIIPKITGKTKFTRATALDSSWLKKALTPTKNYSIVMSPFSKTMSVEILMRFFILVFENAFLNRRNK